MSSFSSNLDPRLVGLYRQPIGQAGQTRTFNPDGQILAPNSHVGFKLVDVLNLTDIIDQNGDKAVDRTEIDRALEALNGPAGQNPNSPLSFALRQMNFEIDRTRLGQVSEHEQRRQIAGSILQTMKDYYTAIDGGERVDGKISTQDIINVNANDTASRYYIDGNSAEAARDLSSRYFTNADLQAALALSSGDVAVGRATDPNNIPGFNQYQTRDPNGGGYNPGYPGQGGGGFNEVVQKFMNFLLQWIQQNFLR